MRDRKRYNELDEVGFVGVQKKMTAKEIRREKIETRRSINSLKTQSAGSNKMSSHLVNR